MVNALLNAFSKNRVRKNFLFNLLDEMNINLERYFVIDQRQFISLDFAMQAWGEARRSSEMVFPPEVEAYAAALEDFNRAFADCRACEEVYSSSLENKTLETARVLHAKKEALEEKFKDIQPRILAAQQALREKMEKRF